MQDMLARVQSVVLISGNTGTGKSKSAKEIHEKSSRNLQPFINVNLAGLTENLFESELFGHRKGAFTGAIENKKGRLSLVKKGTLFLDEIGELGLGQQKKLLELLESKTYYPVGSTEEHKFEGVIIAATNKDLKEMVKKKKFREDLFFRLRIFELNLADISQLSNLKECIQQEFENRKIKENKFNIYMSKECLNRLDKYSWPGNYRELINLMERLVLLNNGRIELKDLPEWILDSEDENDVSCNQYWEAVHSFEKRYLTKKLRENLGKVNQTSREIGISKTSLITKIKKYNISSIGYTQKNELYGIGNAV